MPRKQQTRIRCLPTRPWLVQERETRLSNAKTSLSSSPSIAPHLLLSVPPLWGHIGNGHEPTVSAARIPDYGRVPRLNAWTCILWDAERRVLCLLSTPRLSDIEHVQWSKRNSRHLVYWHWSERIASAGQLGKFGVDIGTYTLWLLTPRSAILRRGNAG
jgi:hypothetical protein